MVIATADLTFAQIAALDAIGLVAFIQETETRLEVGWRLVEQYRETNDPRLERTEMFLVALLGKYELGCDCQEGVR